MHGGLVPDLRHIRPRARRLSSDDEDSSRRRRELFRGGDSDNDDNAEESHRQRDEGGRQPHEAAATCTQSSMPAPEEIDLTLSPESEDVNAFGRGPTHADDDSDDEVQIVGWTAPGESSDSVDFEPRKRRRCVSDPNGVESTSATVANAETLERFSAALRCSICLDHIRKMTSTHCGHVFCGSCIRAQIRANRKCPLCQRHLQSTDVHPLFF